MIRAELRAGDWRTALAGIQCDCLITDPPYSPATDAGYRTTGQDGVLDEAVRLPYAPLSEAYCHAFAESWAHRVGGWWVVFGDDISVKWWRSAFDSIGLYTFPPVVWVKLGAVPRFAGDGPAPWAEYIAVARPKAKEYLGWGSLPGWYQGQVNNGVDYHGVSGSKGLNLMRALIRDYTRPGWVVCDPHAGTGTTLIAARQEGRHSIGAELDPATYAIAARRIGEPYTPDLFGPSPSLRP